MECQNPGCEVLEPQFYSRNRSICKECFLKKHEEEKEQKRLKQRNIKKAAKDAVKKEKMLEKAKQEIKALREKEKTESADKPEVSVKRGRKKVDSKEPKPSVPVALGNAYMAMNPSGMVRSDPGLTGIIATQQKMIEYQQRQTDHLFALTEKLMNRLAPVPVQVIEPKTLSDLTSPAQPVSVQVIEPKTLSGEAKVASFESEEITARIIPPTPRRYPRLSHTKDRRTNDIASAGTKSLAT